MSHWGFILAAYGATIAGTVGLVAASWLAMRRAERQADALRNER